MAGKGALEVQMSYIEARASSFKDAHAADCIQGCKSSISFQIHSSVAYHIAAIRYGTYR